MRKSLVIVFVLCCFGFGISQRPNEEYEIGKPKQVLKVSRLGTRDVAITCKNGADPAGYKKADILIVSCGYQDDINKK